MSIGTIIYIGGFELPDKNAAAHRVLSNGKILRELGYNVVFIDVDKKLKYDNEILNTKKIIQGFECYSLPYPQSNKQWIYYLSNIEFFIKVLSQYTEVKAVICYNYQAIALMKLKRYCNKDNIKIIADCTEWYSAKGTNILFKIIKGFDSFLRMRIVQKNLDGVIVISRYLEKFYENCKNVTRIPPLVDLSEDKWNMPVSEFDDNKIHFVYAGSPGKNKDKINLFIESLYELKELSNYVFDIVGITKEQYISDFKEHKEIVEYLGNRISFHGRLSHSESLKYIKIADFSVFIREDARVTQAGFPTKFVESISCGTPVITTKTSDLDDYIVEGGNGFFIDIGDGNAVSVLRKVLGMNTEEIMIMRKSCIKSRIFHYRNYSNQMEEFINKVIS